MSRSYPRPLIYKPATKSTCSLFLLGMVILKPLIRNSNRFIYMRRPTTVWLQTYRSDFIKDRFINGLNCFQVRELEFDSVPVRSLYLDFVGIYNYRPDKMAEHQALEGQFTTVTFFGACTPKFPAVATGDQLPTDVLLEASKQILPFLGRCNCKYLSFL